MSDSGPCLWRPLPQSGQVPCDRSKHACCSYRGDVFVLGGRHSGCLRDFWKYSVVRNEWTELKCGCDAAPEELEEHTMVAHKGFLYVFGGMMDSAFTSHRCPLWMFDIKKQMWVKPRGRTGWVQTPRNRKGHSAVVMGSTMMIYGGLVDVRGSSAEFWSLHFDLMSWRLLGASQRPSQGPGPRHSHSAVAFQSDMYVFGGLKGLQERRDLWKWNNSTNMWTSVSTKSGPPRLMGHSAVTYRDSMFLFGGGECQDSPHSSLWKFSFVTQRWTRVTTLPGSDPPEKIHHCCAGIGRGYASNTVLPAQTGNAWEKLGKDSRALKNRCYPVRPIFQDFEDAIEMQTLGSDGSSSSDLDGVVCRDLQMITLTSDSKAFRTQLNCLQEALGGKEEDEDFSEHLPDLLLVLGGRPVSHHSPISVWQMTLTNS